MHVRRIRPDDVESYREMRIRALTLAPYAYGTTLGAALDREYEDWEGFVLRAASADNLALFVLDRGDGALAGSAAAMVNPEVAEMDIIQMWLDEDLRGRGWAERILGAAEAYALTRGRGACVLWVADGNDRARRFYERTGYALTGREETSERGIREFLMRKELPT